MPRRARVTKRQTLPDARYSNRLIGMLINKVMYSGKKGTAERIVYGALDQVREQQDRDAVELFEAAMQNVTPSVEVKPRRVGGATYQVPVDIRAERRTALALRWLLTSARARKGRTMSERLAAEVMDAASNQGATIKRKEDTHRMAEANRAFVHYRW